MPNSLYDPDDTDTLQFSMQDYCLFTPETRPPLNFSGEESKGLAHTLDAPNDISFRSAPHHYVDSQAEQVIQASSVAVYGPPLKCHDVAYNVTGGDTPTIGALQPPQPDMWDYYTFQRSVEYDQGFAGLFGTENEPGNDYLPRSDLDMWFGNFGG